jgi:tetratricopeptide (TPR) repeat protein
MPTFCTYANILYRAGEYDRVDEILQRAASEKLFHPDLKKLELQSYLRRGELDPASGILEDLLTDDPNNLTVLLSLARIKMWQNKFAEAGELMDKLKIQDPNSLPVKAAEIELNVRQGKYAEAIALCDELINKLNNALAYILRARIYAMIEQTDKAREDFEHATTTEPNNAGAWAAKSDFYRSIGQLDKAIADIQQALSIAPGNLQIQKRAISLLLPPNNPDRVLQGRAILDEALKANPEDVELRLYKVHFLLAEGTAPAIENAVRILQKITKDQPKISQAWLLLGELSLRQGESGEAMDIALQGLEHNPSNRTLLLLKARAEGVRSPVQRIPTLRDLLERDPNYIDAALLLASTYIEVSEPEKAVNLLKKQLVSCSGTPDERKVNLVLAVALYKNGNKAEAQKIFDLLYQSAPDDPAPLFAQVGLLKDDKLWSRLNQMVVDWCQNHPEDSRTPITIAGNLAATEDSQAKKIAEDLLRRILANDPNSLPAMNALAMLLQNTDRSEEAAKLYERILKLQPDNVVAINNLAWALCEEQGKHQQALELAQRGLEIAPNYVDLIDTRGVAYYRLGQFDKAVQDFTRCIRLYPVGTPAAAATYFHLGRALASLGQKDEAIENLNKALELNAEIGGLSPTDTEEAQRLLKELLQGS